MSHSFNNKRSKTHDSVSCSCDRYNDCRRYAAGNFLDGLDHSAYVSAAGVVWPFTVGGFVNDPRHSADDSHTGVDRHFLVNQPLA